MPDYTNVKWRTCRARIAIIGTIVSVVVCVTVPSSGKIDPSVWTHFIIADRLPGSAWGTGGIPLADFDGDGDIDIITKVWNKDGSSYHTDYWRNDINQ